MDETIQDKVYSALEDNDWHTVGEVAQAIGVKPNTTIRCTLDTMVYCGRALVAWGKSNRQYTKFYKLSIREEEK